MEKRSLLQKYDIPVSHLDFEYIKTCKDAKKIERIVSILRSGEEGYYPELTKCAEDKLRELKPNSKVFRTEERILTKSSLSSEEWKEHGAPIIEWSEEIKTKDKILSKVQESSEIDLPPIRKGGKVYATKEKAAASPVTCSSGSNTRIAATNYNEWDKYDADAEILKIDLEEERVKEHVERMNKINQEKLINSETVEEDKTNIYEKLTPIEREKLAEDYKILGNECFKSGEYSTALEHYSRCIQVHPTPTGYNNRAITQLKLMRYTAALSDCEECLRREPGNLKALLRKAECYRCLGKKLDAYQTYEQVKLIAPDNAIACKAIENLRSELGDVAPLHATRIEIAESEPNPKPIRTPEAKEQSKSLPKPDYDLAELIKPKKLVRSPFAKTMENLGQCTPKKEQQRAKPINDSSHKIKLQIGDSANRVPSGKCLIQEL